MVNTHGVDHLILLGIDHGHRITAGIYGVDLAPLGVGRQSGRPAAYLQGTFLANIHQVKHCNRAGGAICDVRVLAIVRREGRERIAMATGEEQQTQGEQGRNTQPGG